MLNNFGLDSHIHQKQFADYLGKSIFFNGYIQFIFLIFALKNSA